MSIDPDKLHIIPSKPKYNSHADAISHFEGDYECLSNTYKCLISVRGETEPYPSVEHALQASKTNDVELKATIRQAKNAIEAKKSARVIKPTPEWRAQSESILEALLRDKFRRHAKAREVLLGTGRVKLIYNNSHNDRVWGMCGSKGDNKLGKLLERVRADALAGKDTERWCATRFQLPAPLDVAVDLAVTKEARVVAEPSFEGKPVIRMGKLADNDVVMAHPSVSRFHALLVIDKALGAHLVDLGTSNGSFVDGRRVAPFVPEPIKAGGETLTFSKSKRSYTLTKAETDLREAKKRRLYASMSDPTASATEPDPDSTIYVGNLDHSVTEDTLREFFSECGSIASVRIPQEKETGKIRGIAFVSFAKHSGVLHALTLDGDDLKGKGIKIRRAESKPENKAPKNANPAAGGGANGNLKAAGIRSDGRREENGARGRPSGGGDPAAKIALEVVARAAVMRVADASKARATVTESGSDEKSPTKRKVGDSGDPSAGEDQRRKRRGRWGDYGRVIGEASEINAEPQNGGGRRDGDGHKDVQRHGGDRRGDDGQKRGFGSGREINAEPQNGGGRRDGDGHKDVQRHGGDRRGDDGRKRGFGSGRNDAGKLQPDEERTWRTSPDGRSSDRGRRKHHDGHRDRPNHGEARDRAKKGREDDYLSIDGGDRRGGGGRDRRERHAGDRRERHNDRREGDEAHGRRYGEDRGDMGRMRSRYNRDAERRERSKQRSRSRSRDRR